MDTIISSRGAGRWMDISYTGSINKPLVFQDVGFYAGKGRTISLGELGDQTANHTGIS
jgi:hypothetical protein